MFMTIIFIYMLYPINQKYTSITFINNIIIRPAYYNINNHED